MCSGASIPGTDAIVRATCLWDPEGPGPLQPVVAIGGEFVAAGTVVANCVAAFDPASGTWSALGTGMSLAPGPASVRLYGGLHLQHCLRD